mmetsp:Transcript_24392/g.37290  ORF Transcript_24392/g.37290 Transcript_24392/m.37290 type:complete len:377 (+) Transcript_24392:90-1220(+)|eukprot:CAMPEP_0194084378 /NCGR_PEP_ID=MMETSP0149-20130528/13043_1 /TAXON_ID=122233 /ORGANISM="Chaetoceros debilis, Strain MM31A-1" /LENGTH=376 /DNA_ID=CAMNT_0038767023 /DNA_START=64 /DNA_END=1194 /DNA_ORIENTATION=-
MKSIIPVALLSFHAEIASSFSVTNNPLPLASRSRFSTISTATTLHNSGDAIDVEFTKSSEDSDKEKNSNRAQEGNGSKSASVSGESPLEASLNTLPSHLKIPVEFTDPISKSFIPCNLAFVMEMEGTEFSIGTPVHAQVAIFCEDDGTGQGYFVDPDLDDNLELMEMAAAKFEELNKVNLIFARTPRTLTIQGDLESLIGGWKVEDDRPLSEEINVLDECSNTEADDAFFDSFFKEELGENYRDEILVKDKELDSRVEEIVDLFSIPGLGTEKEDNDGMVDLINEIEKDRKKVEENPSLAMEEKDEGALRLVGFEGPDGRPYSLVKMLQPMILVARKDERLAPDQRILLSKEEADEIIPVLEKDFKADLAEAGLSP